MRLAPVRGRASAPCSPGPGPGRPARSRAPGPSPPGSHPGLCASPLAGCASDLFRRALRAGPCVSPCSGVRFRPVPAGPARRAVPFALVRARAPARSHPARAPGRAARPVRGRASDLFRRAVRLVPVRGALLPRSRRARAPGRAVRPVRAYVSTCFVGVSPQAVPRPCPGRASARNRRVRVGAVRLGPVQARASASSLPGLRAGPCPPSRPGPGAGPGIVLFGRALPPRSRRARAPGRVPRPLLGRVSDVPPGPTPGCASRPVRRAHPPPPRRVRAVLAVSDSGEPAVVGSRGGAPGSGRGGVGDKTGPNYPSHHPMG